MAVDGNSATETSWLHNASVIHGGVPGALDSALPAVIN